MAGGGGRGFEAGPTTVVTSVRPSVQIIISGALLRSMVIYDFSFQKWGSKRYRHCTRRLRVSNLISIEDLVGLSWSTRWGCTSALHLDGSILSHFGDLYNFQ